MTPSQQRPRLRRSDCSRPGLTRVKRGRGFSYLDADGRPLKDPEELLRLKALAIPPAWQDVWICPDPRGHLQATGVDAAGRKQYLYHPRWRELRDRQKFDHMVDFAHALPRLRKRMLADLDGEELDERRVLACAVRLLDVGLFRIGSEQYADEEGGVGLATVDQGQRPDRATTRWSSTTWPRAGCGACRPCRTRSRRRWWRPLKRRRSGRRAAARLPRGPPLVRGAL